MNSYIREQLDIHCKKDKYCNYCKYLGECRAHFAQFKTKKPERDDLHHHPHKFNDHRGKCEDYDTAKKNNHAKFKPPHFGNHWKS